MSPDLDTQWVTVPLSQVLDFREGPGIMAYDFRKEGVPLLRLAGLRREFSLLAGCNYLDPEMVAKRWAHFRVHPGDVLLSTSASLGEVAVVDESAQDAIPYTGIIRFRSRDERLRQDFIPHALTAPSFKRQIEAMGVGSVLRHFGPMHLRQMTIDLPPVSVQKAIVEVLGALDDKIDSNSAIAMLSEQLAVTMLEQTDAQLPIATLASVDRTQIATREFSSSIVDHFSLPAFDARRLPERIAGKSIKSNKFKLSGPSVLVSKLNPHIPRIWHAVPRSSAMSLASTEFVVLRPRSEFTSEELWAACATRSFSDALAELVTGTTGSHQRVRPEDVVQSPVVDLREVPSTVRELVRHLVNRSSAARMESTHLVDLRDELLPPLLSGDLLVRKAKSLAEDAI
jgi:type I restriction enzyme S subunit